MRAFRVTSIMSSHARIWTPGCCRAIEITSPLCSCFAWTLRRIDVLQSCLVQADQIGGLHPWIVLLVRFDEEVEVLLLKRRSSHPRAPVETQASSAWACVRVLYRVAGAASSSWFTT